MISYGGAQDHETSSADSEWGLRLTREDIQLKTDKSFIPSLEAVREHVMEYGALSSFAWSEFEHKMKHRAALFAGVANGTAPTKTTVDAALANVPPSSRYRLYGRNFELKQRQESAGANIEPPTLVEISRGVLAFCLDFEFDLQLAQAHLHWHINGHQIYEERRRNSGMPLSPHALSTLIAAFPQEIGKFNQHLIVRQRITLQVKKQDIIS